MDVTLTSGKSVFVEKHCASSEVGHVEPIREKLVVDTYSIASCSVMMCHFPAICFSMAP